jgi:flagellar hook-length control protein FliK
MELGVEAALNLGTPAIARSGAGATASPKAPGRIGRPAARESVSFQDELRAAASTSTRACDRAEASDHEAPAEDEVADLKPAKADATPGCRGKEADTQPAADIASLLLQLLQGGEPAAPTPPPAPDTPAVAEERAANEDAASEMLARVLELLKQVAEAPSGARPPYNQDTARLAELLGQLEELSGAAQPTALAGKVHQMLTELREHLSRVAWGKMVKETFASGLPAAPEPGQTDSRSTAPEPAGLTLINSNNRLEAIVSAVRSSMPAAVSAGSELKATTAESRSVLSTEPIVEASKSANLAGETPASPRLSAVVTAAANSGDGQRGSNISETQRPSTAVFQTETPEAGIRGDQNADRSGSRESATDRSLWKELSGADAAPDNGTSADSFEITAPADPRLTRLHDTGPERTADAVATGKEKEPAAGSARTGVFDQIVQRTVVQLRNDQSEIKIDLKPDFLGNVRMQIVTENQQVSVRITTEFPAVRDMIEAGLQQLKSELQNQGLHVDRLEVAVSDDQYRQSRRQDKHEEKLGTDDVEEVAAADGRPAKERLEPVYYRPWPGAAVTIDMFA